MTDARDARLKELAESYWLNGRIDKEFFIALAQEAADLQRAIDAPYMQHKEGCPQASPAGWAACTCGLNAFYSTRSWRNR